MTNNKLLKFPSQRQLVDRLLHLIEFNNPFIFLSGKTGCGHTTISEALLIKLPEKVRAISLIGSSGMKMTDIRHLLLSQIVTNPLFNIQDALSDSLFRMLEGTKPTQLLLVIEQADQLPIELLDELWGVACHNDKLTTPHRLAIIVSGNDTWCQKQIPLLRGRTTPPLELEILPLSPPEQRIFLYEKAKQLKIPTALLPKLKVEEILITAGGHPSTLMQLLEEIMTDKRPKKRQSKLPVATIISMLLIIVGGLLALGYVLPRLNDEQSTDVDQTSTNDANFLPPSVGNIPATTDSVNDVGSNKNIERMSDNTAIANPNRVVKDWQIDATALPKLVEGNTITTESTHYEGRRVVIADEVVQKLMSEPKVSAALPTHVVNTLAGKGAVDAASTVREDAAKNAQEIPKSTQPKSVNVKKEGREQFSGPVLKVPLTAPSFLAQKPRSHYSIQLMGASNTQAVNQFVSKHGLVDKVWVYQTQFRGSPWYVVLQGDYSSAAQVKSAIRQLSPGLLKGQPWPKSFAQVQKELKAQP
ncbi:SPOR domain-containing protein [Aeromonas cavernicola]|uniref:Cell division protein DamX n=1 Tax=Aeromonas cavernicola TaxID=1006623 RepID=A0A2H9U9R6_9GAMM|nr:AAA family ATPase [Aeromonas cavernicola]PJG60719.1 cell division protein DamX [Aeromonas cavernicola]